MSFDEEGDHYMSKADFAMMCDELKKAVSQRDELFAALKELRAAEWMMCCDYGNPSDRSAILDKTDAAIAKATELLFRVID